MSETAKDGVRVALIQLLADSDKEANLAQAERFVREAAGRGAQLVALPEQFSWRGKPFEEQAAAEAIPDGPTVRACVALARELGIHLLAGSLLERVEGNERVFNTSVLIDPAGEVLGTYRKIHLFDVDVKGARAVTESRYREHGADTTVIKTVLGSLGLSVCYDLRFPILFRRLALLGAQVVCLPACFLQRTGQAHWEVLLRARAIENGVFVIAPNQVGEGPDGMINYGNSMIVDPWGEILARGGEEATIVEATIDMGRVEGVRAQIPTLDHIRLRCLPEG